MASCKDLEAIVFLLSMLGTCNAAEFCFTDNGQEYCIYNCCSGSCCPAWSWMVGLIVTGCILFIGFVVIVIICVVKSQQTSGRVVHPAPQSNIAVVSSGSTGYYYGPNPPPYAVGAQPYPSTAPPPPTDPYAVAAQGASFSVVKSTV